MSNEAAGSSTSMPAAGWFPDPAGSGGYRYWDGVQWTGHCSMANAASYGAGAVRNDSLAVPAMILSLVGLFTSVTAAIGLIMGIISLTRIRNSGGTVGGRGFALTAVIVGGLITLLTVVLLIWVVWAVAYGADSYWYSDS